MQGMAVSESQPSMSHEQLVSNRDALERKLSQRGPREELVSRGIMPAVSAAPSIISQRTKLERAKTGDLLQKKIRGRPTRGQLVQRHILKETPGAVDPSLIDKQMRLKRKKLEDNLNDKLSFRPGPLELVKQNILEAGTEMSHAVQEGAVPFTDTTAIYEETLSPESTDSPEPSPEPSIVASPPSVVSSPGSTCISSSVQALASLQAQTRKHSLEQQEQQQQQHQLFLQQQNGLQQPLPSQLPVSSAGIKKETRPRKKTAKSKVKKYKYHEYRPPNGDVQKSELPSDSPYGLLLQQQQLYLQLQVLFQNYPQHCMLPSIPENVKLGANCAKTNNKDSDSDKDIKIEDMRVVDMRRALKERGLPVFGSKTDLIKRLKECGALSSPESNSSTTSSPVVVSSQGQITTAAQSISQPQLGLPKHLLQPLQRSNSAPLQNPNLNTVQQLQMQILANNQSLQQLNVPPEVQQQLQQLQYLNLQLQLQQLNIQQQQNIQPKPQDIATVGQTGTVKTETLMDKSCSLQGRSVEQSQVNDEKPKPCGIQHQSRCMQMTPGNVSFQHQQVQPHIDHPEKANSLDSIDSNPGSVESQILSWDQQHPLFDGGSESYPSPGSQHSDLSNLSPLQVDHLSRSMEAIPSTNLCQGNSKADIHLMQRSYSERSPSEAPDDYFIVVPQTKPRSLSEPQFPVSTHKRSMSSPSAPYTTPPPSYEAHMAAKQHQQHRNVGLEDQMVSGCSFTKDVSPKHNDLDLPLDSVIQDKELSQELQKAMIKNFPSFNHDDILEILGEPRSQQPTTSVTTLYGGVVSPSYSSPGAHLTQTRSKSPNFGPCLSQRTLQIHNSPGRISKSCEDVSRDVAIGSKFLPQLDNNAVADIDHYLCPMSPMKIDSCDADENSGLLSHSSNSIPIPSSNFITGRTENLNWLDLSVSPNSQILSHGNVDVMHNNNHKGTPPPHLYDPLSTFRDEHFPLSLFDLETPTALHPPSDFGETMDYCV